ncbi:Aldo/keto reductase [Patellaria atrata CBS 101060]|uniref:Aldo/keto reductase n=1 Tax=Patellaria atrata CBS 101060 TaxID=1346257 RepID=A0A9P4SH32_9PEZI|nr:Aldo/keto reductase [Patellaria atrata CBS 101060]
MNVEGQLLENNKASRPGLKRIFIRKQLSDVCRDEYRVDDGSKSRPPPTSESIKALKQAFILGANHWNAAQHYGPPHANSLHLRDYFTQYPGDADEVVISVKGVVNLEKFIPDGSPENVKRSIDEYLRVLDGKKFLDIFTYSRVDGVTPVEEMVLAIKKYVDEGKVGGIAISECSAQTIRRAAIVAKIDAVELEFSLWATEILENGVAATCGELGIPTYAYPPIGRGILTGHIKSLDDLAPDDRRRNLPHFASKDVFQENLRLVKEVDAIAEKKGVTPG